MRTALKNTRVFYGWFVVAASGLMLFFNSGAQYAFGVMFKPIIREFGWSRGAISLVFLMNMAVFAAGLTVVGKVYDRYGPKWVIIVSTLLVSGGFALTSFVHSIGQFFFSYGVLAAAGLAGTGVPLVATVVSKWFDKWRGMAISLSLSGSSLGAFVLVPLLSLSVLSRGWRASYLYLGIAVVTANILIALFVIKGDPHGLGIEPFGRGRADEGGAAPGRRPPPPSALSGFGLRQAMATRSYWLFVATMFVCGSGDFFATSHFINIATDQGVSPLLAGRMMGWYGLMSLAGILIAGPAADRIGSKIPIVLTFVLRLALYLFILKYKSTTALYLFALLFGFTHLVTAPLTPMLIGTLYGTSQLGLLTGFINTVHFLGGGFWTYMTGLIFDKTGSYQLAFLISAAAAAAAALCTACVVEKRHGGVSIDAGEGREGGTTDRPAYEPMSK
jgi:MFS family permease